MSVTSQHALNPIMGEPEAADPEIGRRYVIAAIVLMALVSVAVSAFWISRYGTDRLPQQIGRLVLLGGLAYALLTRRRWARWLTAFLLFAALFVGVGPLIRPGAFSGDQLWRTLPLLVVYVGYAIILRGFLYSRSVSAFFGASQSRVSSSDADHGTPPSPAS